MPRWLSKVLPRIRKLAGAQQVRFTLKARRELACLDVGLDEVDACEVLAKLTVGQSAGRRASAATGEWMYLFTPCVGGTTLYVKLILRTNCVVVSFHADEAGNHEEEDP